MLLRGVLQALGCQRLQRTDNAEARVARFDHVVEQKMSMIHGSAATSAERTVQRIHQDMHISMR